MVVKELIFKKRNDGNREVVAKERWWHKRGGDKRVIAKERQ